MSINFPDSPTFGQVYAFGSRSWTWNGYAWDVAISASAGGITGTVNEIEVISLGITSQIGLPDDVTISGNLDILGNINILGTLVTDGLIITKSGFQGYTGNSSLEPIDGVYLDGGIF